MPFITVSALNKRYRVGTQDIHVLRDLDLAVEAGEMVAVMGASGVGKSTCCTCSAGSTGPTAARVVVEGRDLGALSDDELVGFRNARVGFVFQFHHLLPEFSALENAEMPMRIARRPPRGPRAAARRLLEAVGLAERLDHRPSMLSGGEQQRVAVARALVMQPALVLADEPTGDLDERTGDSLNALFREMHRERGLTSVIATHNPRLAAACDRVLRLEGGTLVPA